MLVLGGYVSPVDDTGGEVGRMDAKDFVSTRVKLAVTVGTESQGCG